MAQITTLQPSGIPGKIRTFLAKIAAAIMWREIKKVQSTITVLLQIDSVISTELELNSAITTEVEVLSRLDQYY